MPAGSSGPASGKPVLWAMAVPKPLATSPLALSAASCSRSFLILYSLLGQRLLPHTRQWQTAQLQGRNAPPTSTCAVAQEVHGCCGLGP